MAYIGQIWNIIIQIDNPNHVLIISRVLGQELKFLPHIIFKEFQNSFQY